MLALSSPHAVTATPHLLSLRDLSFFLSFFFNLKNKKEGKSQGFPPLFFLFFWVGVVLGFELRASHLLGWYCIT
jgi:hypothetical protein